MKFSMKRLFSVLLSVLMLLSITACGTTEPNPSQSDTNPPESDVPPSESDADPKESATDPIESDETPETAEPEPEHIPDPDYKYVVIVGVDGAGAFFKDVDTPNLDEIFADGAVTYEAQSTTPSESSCAWGSLLHGVLPEFHGLNNGNINSLPAYPMDSAFPSVFRVIREQMPDAELASFCHWDPINTAIIEDGIDVYKWNEKDTDRQVLEAAGDYVKALAAEGKGAPTLLYIQLDTPDEYGHLYGWGSEFYMRLLGYEDPWIRGLYDTYAELGLLEDTLFIVTADHGGYEKNHGGSTPEEMNIIFAAAGKTVAKGTVGEMEIRDIASIVLHALDLKQPETWTSRVPSGVFEGVEAGERPVVRVSPAE